MQQSHPGKGRGLTVDFSGDAPSVLPSHGSSRSGITPPIQKHKLHSTSVGDKPHCKLAANFDRTSTDSAAADLSQAEGMEKLGSISPAEQQFIREYQQLMFSEGISQPQLYQFEPFHRQFQPGQPVVSDGREQQQQHVFMQPVHHQFQQGTYQQVPISTVPLSPSSPNQQQYSQQIKILKRPPQTQKYSLQQQQQQLLQQPLHQLLQQQIQQPQQLLLAEQQLQPNQQKMQQPQQQVQFSVPQQHVEQQQLLLAEQQLQPNQQQMQQPQQQVQFSVPQQHAEQQQLLLAEQQLQPNQTQEQQLLQEQQQLQLKQKPHQQQENQQHYRPQLQQEHHDQQRPLQPKSQEKKQRQQQYHHQQQQQHQQRQPDQQQNQQPPHQNPQQKQQHPAEVSSPNQQQPAFQRMLLRPPTYPQGVQGSPPMLDLTSMPFIDTSKPPPPIGVPLPGLPFPGIPFPPPSSEVQRLSPLPDKHTPTQPSQRSVVTPPNTQPSPGHKPRRSPRKPFAGGDGGPPALVDTQSTVWDSIPLGGGYSMSGDTKQALDPSIPREYDVPSKWTVKGGPLQADHGKFKGPNKPNRDEGKQQQQVHKQRNIKDKPKGRNITNKDSPGAAVTHSSRSGQGYGSQVPPARQAQETGGALSKEQEKNEYEWQSFKIIRKVRKILGDLKDKGDVEKAAAEITDVMEKESARLACFPWPKEQFVALDEIMAWAMDRPEMVETVCRLILELHKRHPDNFQEDLTNTVMKRHMQCIKVSTATNKEKLYATYTGLISQLYMLSRSANSAFQTIIGKILDLLISKWIACNAEASTQEPTQLVEVYAFCLRAMFVTIGPHLPAQTDKKYNLLLRDQVLGNQPRFIKEAMLDLLLLRAAGWKELPAEFKTEESFLVDAKDTPAADKTTSADLVKEKPDDDSKGGMESVQHQKEVDSTPPEVAGLSSVLAKSPAKALPENSIQSRPSDVDMSLGASNTQPEVPVLSVPSGSTSEFMPPSNDPSLPTKSSLATPGFTSYQLKSQKPSDEVMDGLTSSSTCLKLKPGLDDSKLSTDKESVAAFMRPMTVDPLESSSGNMPFEVGTEDQKPGPSQPGSVSAENDCCLETEPVKDDASSDVTPQVPSSSVSTAEVPKGCASPSASVSAGGSARPSSSMPFPTTYNRQTAAAASTGQASSTGLNRSEIATSPTDIDTKPQTDGISSGQPSINNNNSSSAAYYGIGQYSVEGYLPGDASDASQEETGLSRKRMENFWDVESDSTSDLEPTSTPGNGQPLVSQGYPEGPCPLKEERPGQDEISTANMDASGSMAQEPEKHSEGGTQYFCLPSLSIAAESHQSFSSGVGGGTAKLQQGRCSGGRNSPVPCLGTSPLAFIQTTSMCPPQKRLLRKQEESSRGGTDEQSRSNCQSFEDPPLRQEELHPSSAKQGDIVRFSTALEIDQTATPMTDNSPEGDTQAFPAFPEASRTNSDEVHCTQNGLPTLQSSGKIQDKTGTSPEKMLPVSGMPHGCTVEGKTSDDHSKSAEPAEQSTSCLLCGGKTHRTRQCAMFKKYAPRANKTASEEPKSEPKPEPEEPKKSSFGKTFFCSKCGKEGHLIYDCPVKGNFNIFNQFNASP